MRLKGEAVNAIAQGEVRIPRGDSDPIILRVQALPLGHEELAEQMFPSPTAPLQYAESRGGKILRDPATRKPITVRNLEDSDYKAAVRITSRHQMMFFVHAALKADDTVEWETEEVAGQDPKEFYTDLYNELKAAGFSVGDLRLIVDAVMELSNLSGEDIQEAKEDFLSQEPSV